MIDHVRGELGEVGVQRLLRTAGCTRSVAYLEDLGNWISYDEAIALFAAGEEITGDREFARKIGTEAAELLAGSPVAALLRSLGSTEEVYRQLVQTAPKFNVVTDQEVDHVEPGFARLKVAPAAGFPRSRAHCEHTQGLFSCTPMLFGLGRATITHTECAADGAPACVYEIAWDPAKPARNDVDDIEVAALRTQLDAMAKRLQGVFDTAADLIASDDIETTLARITERAALEVRAPRHLLAVREPVSGRLKVLSRGFDDHEATAVAERVLNGAREDLPDSWIVSEVSSHRNHYGRLVAFYSSSEMIMNEERELLDVYSRYAATALDSATALLEARRRHAEADALLELARALAAASSRSETTARLSAAIPSVIDCDRAELLVWDEGARTLTDCSATEAGASATLEAVRPLCDLIAQTDSEALFIDDSATDTAKRALLRSFGAAAAALVPIRSNDAFLGALVLRVERDAERLRRTPELADLLTGVAAHAASALENAILLDAITYQARHDGLTGLVNRTAFTDQLREASERAQATSDEFSLFYIDIDMFKSVNDELGHAAGDDLLRQIADRLRACVRNDDMVARLGGDEYAVIVEGREAGDSASVIASRLAAAFDEPFTVAGRRFRVKASIGRANWNGDRGELDSLVREADSAMYAVKRRHHAAARDRAAAGGATLDAAA